MPPRVPPAGDLIKVIRRLAEAGAVRFTGHAFKRSGERDIDMLDALAVLKNGTIKGGIVPGDNPGEWKCKVVGKVEDSGRINVVTVIERQGRLLIVTVWEDT